MAHDSDKSVHAFPFCVSLHIGDNDISSRGARTAHIFVNLVTNDISENITVNPLIKIIYQSTVQTLCIL